MGSRVKPSAGDWRDHLAPRGTDEECIQRRCPECGKPACIDWYKDIEHEGYKVVAFRHGHFLKDRFEQKRNYNHLLKGSRTKLKEGELIDTTRIKRAKIPDSIAEQFAQV